jgi:RHS repeat-associated protein
MPVDHGASSSHAPLSAQSDPRAPQLTVPKGGGAIRGIGEKFAANPVTGTASLTIPVYASPGRAGFTPDLRLSYDSGAGNGAFGFGWALDLPSITRKTDKGVPRYAAHDASAAASSGEPDVFLLSGVDDLVPVLTDAGNGPLPDVRTRELGSSRYRVARYRPRIEGLFARIELWANTADATDTFWRAISKDNVTRWYGTSGESRVADPAEPARIFSWLLCASHDDKGNVMAFSYKPEDSAGVELTAAHEHNRTEASRSAGRYPKRVTYGNRLPWFLDADSPQPLTLPEEWLFELVFDYGEHDADAPTPEQRTAWLARPDPFSRYRSGFEIRTYRLCRRVLMFHRFAELGDAPVLVRSTDLSYALDADPAQATTPVFSFLASATQKGYTPRAAGGYVTRAFPPLEFEYSRAVLHSTVREIDAASAENLPAGLDPAHAYWIDLDGEGLPGALSQSAGAWTYKRNLGPVSSSLPAGMRLGALERLSAQPSIFTPSGPTLLDLDGDGHVDLVGLETPVAGFYERTSAGWETFRPFQSIPNIDWDDPNLRFVDLTGDGHGDVLITEQDALRWHPSLAEAGFGAGQRLSNALNDERGPRVVFADGTQSIALADMDGDGLTDLVRLRNGEVCYWPNLGYGRFGSKVTMDNAPWFDSPDRFDHRRIRMGDIDGSGCSDILYLDEGGVCVYFNQSGNAWSARVALPAFPAVDRLASVQVADLMGTGTACLVWSSSHPAHAASPLRYIDLMDGSKPHLLVTCVNNLGAEAHFTYAPSTRFYLADLAAGRPWITRLPFPVHVVERIQLRDRVSGNRFVTRYAYHHGHFDGIEREFRGFAMVEQYDTEQIAALSLAPPAAPANDTDASNVPPVLTRTWFHTGLHVGRNHVSDFFAGLLDANDRGEYYREPGLTDAEARRLLLADTILPQGLTHEEDREACRALKGSMLRQEVYALDGSDRESHPYVVTEQNFSVRMVQPRAGNLHAIFFAHPREVVQYYYERKADDPRVSHTLTLAVDDFGNVLRSAAIAYGRRRADAELPGADQARQAETLATLSENSFTNAIDRDDDYRAPLASETRTYELTGPQVTHASTRRGFDDVLSAFDAAALIDFEQRADGSRLQKRLIGHVRHRYRPDDLGVSAGSALALLPANVLESCALGGETYTLLFTPGLIDNVYGGRVAADMLSEGGYVDLDGDGRWWIPAGRTFYSPDAADPPAQELASARRHFFAVRRFRDPFGNDTTVTLDGYDLLLDETRDAIGNTVAALNDYRALHPRIVTDANGNRSEVAFDALGHVAATAVMGRPGEDVGDTLAGLEPDLGDGEVIAHLAEPLANATVLLQGATTRQVYDLFAYYRSRLDIQPAPVVISRLARVTHHSDLAPGQHTDVRVSLTYSDGFGREVQRKLQAEAGALDRGGPVVSPRWAGSGWTVFNNKGLPVRQFEPFFTDTHRFERDARHGVSPIVCYDPVGRVVGTLHPNHSWQKVVYGAWQQVIWDANDTVLIDDPAADPDVGSVVARLPPESYRPTWYAERIAGALGPHQQAAALKAAVHAATPTVAHTDALGRTFLTVVHNAFKDSAAGPEAPRTELSQQTRVVLDIDGNPRQVVDPLGRIVVRSDYDLAGGQLHSLSMDAGERWRLNDAAGAPLRTWDSRGHMFRTQYDELRRPVRRFVTGSDAAQSDPRVLGREVLFEQIAYGEAHPDARARNLRARAWLVHDAAGIATNEAYDFKGNVVRSSRRFARDYTAALDWSADVPLEDDVYSEASTFDALQRPVDTRAPDGSVVRRSYNEAGLLERIEANLRGDTRNGQPVWTPFVAGVAYNASGQRERVDYGNGVAAEHTYDPLTVRLASLATRRDAALFPEDCPASPPAGWPGCAVQNLHFTYDPVGNVTHIRDDAQQVILFRNHRVDPSSEYVYDATYRLIEGAGREHLGHVGGAPGPPTAPDPWNSVHAGGPHPGDGTAMGRYVERYAYDAAGNLLVARHVGSDPLDSGWTRTYTYTEPSLIDRAAFCNRLTASQVGTTLLERYHYDAHGSMTALPHLPVVQWNYLDQLHASSTQVVMAGVPATTYYVYDGSGRRVRKVTERQAAAAEEAMRRAERIYVGDFELYREYTSDAAIALERETLSMADGGQRIALVETRTAGDDGAAARLIRYQVGNHLGSTTIELNDIGELVSYEEYFPYGATSYQAVTGLASAAKRYRYAGMERDEETGLQYHGVRYLDTSLGRWIACDPAGIAASPCLYAYASNNPACRTDRNGMQDVSQVMSAVYYGRLERDIQGYITGMIGGRADVNISQNKVEYSGPVGGVGGVAGGVIRTGSLRTIPFEQNPTRESIVGGETGAALVPVLDPAERLIGGTTVTGQPTSRTAAGVQLVLDLLPFAVQFKIAAVEARAASTMSQARTVARAFSSDVTPVVRTLEGEAVDVARVRGALTHQAQTPEGMRPPLRADSALRASAYTGRTEAEIIANRGIYNDRFYFDMLIDETGRMRLDLLPDLQQRLGGIARRFKGLGPRDIEAIISGELRSPGAAGGPPPGGAAGGGGGRPPGGAQSSFNLDDISNSEPPRRADSTFDFEDL